MKQTSGVEALLEALKQSGVNVDGAGFGAGKGGAGEGTQGSSDTEGASSGGFHRGPGGFSRQGSDGSAGHHIEIPFIEHMKDWSRRAITIAVIVVVLVLLAAYWWFHPPISIYSPDTWIFVGIFILLPLFLAFRSRSRSYRGGTSKLNANSGKATAFKWFSVVPVVVALVGVAGAVASLAVFPGNAQKYANVLQSADLDFASDIEEVNYAEIPVIDHDSAVLLGNREMGSIPEYVSQFEISDLYSQINYQGEPVRVSPLGYADLFKWFTNRENGIPAYALVNMTTQDAEIVRLDDNPIYYSQSEPLARNIDRYVQLKYPFYLFDEKSFEIDEDGQPWWICPVQKRTIGLFGGTTISRVVMCNATTGECIDLAVEDVPEWVDRVYPAELLIKQYNWSGRYVNGWLNSFLGQEGVVQTTPGSDGELGYNYIAKDDDVWVYTGVTSATADSSIVGFVLVNQRTAESHYYAVAGATEESAMGSAEGQVQNLRYTSTFPLLINVANQPTYFMALKDSEGLVKKFAMIDIQRYQNVAVGDTVEECQEAYLKLLASNGVDTAGEAIETLDAQGIIALMVQAVVDGNSHFYVELEGDDALYDFALPGLVSIVGYQVGDAITFSYMDGDSPKEVESITLADGSVEEVADEEDESDEGADDSASDAEGEATAEDAA